MHICNSVCISKCNGTYVLCILNMLYAFDPSLIGKRAYVERREGEYNILIRNSLKVAAY